MQRVTRLVALVGGFVLSACSGHPSTPTSTDAGLTAAQHPAKQTVFGGKRPVTLSVPANYDNSQPTPLLILLHGYSVNGFEQTIYFGYDQLVNEAGVLFAAPDGTVDAVGNHFWNATDACCDFGHTGVDDVAYLSGLITDISAEYNVDPQRVYLAGHSNGAFMAYRMACDRADLVAAIVVLAGATWADPTKCVPSHPVSVLDLHGTDDQLVLYGGGSTLGNGGGPYPGAVQNVTTWAGYDKCTGSLQMAGASFDLGVASYPSIVEPQPFSGCPQGVDIQLWSIQKGSHVPSLGPEFRARTWAWLAAHPKVE